MGGPILYSCTAGLKRNIPRLLKQEGIEVVPGPLPRDMSRDENFVLVCSRGSGRVKIYGTDDEGDKILLGIEPDHSLLCYWCEDIPLVEDIEKILVGNGAVRNKPISE